MTEQGATKCCRKSPKGELDLTGSERELGEKHSNSTNDKRGEMGPLQLALPAIPRCHPLHMDNHVLNILQDLV